MSHLVMYAEGLNGQCRFFEDSILIQRKGFRGSLVKGPKEKEIPLSQLGSIEYMPAGFNNGHIQFVYRGMVPKTGFAQIANYENAVVFTNKQQPEFERLKSAVQERLATLKQNQARSDINEAGRPTPFLDKGVISGDSVCSNCGRPLLEDAMFCVTCRTPTSHKNVETPSVEKVIMRAKGLDGELLLLKDRVRISRKGTWPRKGDKEILLSRVSAVQFTKAGQFFSGRLQFSFVGGGESKFGSGIDSANTVMFDHWQEKEFVSMKEAIDRRIDSLQTAPKAPSSLDDLEKLASLRDKGIITEDEFQQKKKQILGL